MVEVQGRSGLPHYHCVGWRPLTPAQRELLSSLQAGTSADLTMADLAPLVQLAVAAITVTTSPTILRHQFPLLTIQQAEEAVVLARGLQVHTCTPSCNTVFYLGQQCGERFPRLPSLLNLVARQPPLDTPEEEERFGALEELHRAVQEQLRAREGGEEEEPAALLEVLHQLGPAPQVLPQGGYSWLGIAFTPGEELDSLLLQLGAMAATEADTVVLALYHSTLLLRHQPRFLPRRRVCEATMASYNPWVILALRTNHEVDMLAATPSKVIAYMTKGSQQESLARAAAELRRRGRRSDMAAARRLDSAMAAGHREVTATEACYRLDSRLPFTSSTWGKVVRVSAHLGPGGQVSVTADKERYSQRPLSLDYLCLAQFVMRYRLAYPGEGDAVPQQAGALVPVARALDIDLPPGHLTHLPAVIILQDGQRVRRLKEPRVVDWAPATTYTTILMFKVSL